MKTAKELEEAWGKRLVDVFNEGLAEEYAEENLKEIMEKHFAGISYKELRKLAEEHYPERFI